MKTGGFFSAARRAVPFFALLAAVLLALAPPLAARGQQRHSPVTPAVPYEIRAVWLTTLSGLDWPSHPARTSGEAAAQKLALCRMLDGLRAAGVNVVLFQARIRATSAYRSALEPWDAVFTGKPGGEPPYDPLAFAVQECHKRGMECHAWVVAFPVGKADAVKRQGKLSLAAHRPDLCRKCGDQWMMDPGMPGTGEYLAGVCREIVEGYDVDGVHLDYIRYPERGIAFDDSRTYARYGAGQSLRAWRTANVTRCVRLVHDAVKAVRPWVKLSCSPVGKYADLPRQSSGGWNARDAVCQEAQSWLSEGLMDWLFPMMYFDGKNFYPFLADWKEHDAGREIVPGLGIYFLSEREKDWPLLKVQRQMEVSRTAGLGGAAFFRAKFLLSDVKGLKNWLESDFYARPALVPPLPCAPGDTPAAPKVTQSIAGMRLTLDWEASAAGTPIYYNVYRLDSVCGDRLLAARLAGTHYETVLPLPALRHSRYVVTAVDAYGRESGI